MSPNAPDKNCPTHIKEDPVIQRMSELNLQCNETRLITFFVSWRPSFNSNADKTEKKTARVQPTIEYQAALIEDREVSIITGLN